MKFTQYVLPVVVGAMSGMMLITFGEMIIGKLYPVDQHDADAIIKSIQTLPVNAFLLLIVNYMICSFLAGLISTFVAKRATARPAVVIGIVLTLAGLYNVIYLPHPLWFSIVSLLVYIPCAYFGYLVARKKTVAAGVSS